MTRERKRPHWLTGVAIAAEDGRTIALPYPARHGDLFALAALLKIDAPVWLQGFTGHYGNFITRGEAAKRANLGKPEAFSEDFW